MRRQSYIRASGLVLALIMLLTACTSFMQAETEKPAKPRRSQSASAGPATPPAPAGLAEAVDENAEATAGFDLPEAKAEDLGSSAVLEPMTLLPGTGRFVNLPEAPLAAEAEETGEITLNFEGTDIREVVQSILGDILQQNFIIDPGVSGAVTVHTGRPLSSDDLFPVLETLLRSNNIVLVKDEGLYQVVPAAKAVKGALLPEAGAVPLRAGYRVRVIPLRYISPMQMQKILEPFVQPDGILSADDSRNLLIVAGTAPELARIQETVDIFDVNWLKGMSVGLFRLDVADPKTVASELEEILGSKGDSPIAGMMRFLPIERLGAVLVITPQRAYLDEVRQWVERLDEGEEEAGTAQRLYVYQVQNSDAEHLASLLQSIFAEKVARKTTTAAAKPVQLAPGREPKTVESKGEVNEAVRKAATSSERGTAAGVVQTTAAIGSDEVRVIADAENNALLILSSPRDYQRIRAALRRLDVRPRQVLVEATIAEITLRDAFEFGISWFFKNNNVFKDYSGTGTLDQGINLGLEDLIGNGFTYALTDGAGIVRALLNTLAADSLVKILSSPQILVLDNQQATIAVGDQQPVKTSTTISDGGATTESIQFKDTGVSLDVKPRINAGGLITMEITQDVTDVGDIDEATGQRTFLKRNINSVVAVQSGEEIVLGGLIRENKTEGASGIPGLYTLPVVGSLFGSKAEESTRTELLVLITPRIIRDLQEARQVTDEMRRRMSDVIELYEGAM